MDNDPKVLIENGIPCVKIPAALVAKYGDFIRACIDLNGKLLSDGTTDEFKALMEIAGRILGFAYAVLNWSTSGDSPHIRTRSLRSRGENRKWVSIGRELNA